MSYSLALFFGFSIWIAAIIGFFRFSKIDATFHPFILLIGVAAINELVSYLLARIYHSNAVSLNIYVLVESLLITWQFWNWSKQKKNYLYLSIVLLFIFGWVTEIFFLSSIWKVTFYFRILYAFVVVLLSINMLNYLIIKERKDIVRNPVFLICTAFIFYFTLKIIVHTFWLYGVSVSREFRLQIVYLMIYLNFFVNMIYIVVVLWMPNKPRSLTLS